MRTPHRHVARAVCLSLALGLGLPGLASAMITNGSFETGDLSGWSRRGDVSVVDGSFGTTPSDGGFQILLSTVNTGVNSGLEPDVSYSGFDARTLNNGFERWMRLPTGVINGILRAGDQPGTEGSAIRQNFTANAGEVLQFDWNFVTDETTINPSYDDFAVVTVREDLGGNTYQDVSTSVLVNQAAALYQGGGSGTPLADETGYSTFQLTLPTTANYVLSVAIFDAQDQLVPSVLLVDNTRLVAPEPDTFVLLVLGLVGLTWFGRRRGLRGMHPAAVTP